MLTVSSAEALKNQCREFISLIVVASSAGRLAPWLNPFCKALVGFASQAKDCVNGVESIEIGT